MSYDPKARRFCLNAFWHNRPDDLSSIAPGLQQYVERLSSITPALASWRYGEGKRRQCLTQEDFVRYLQRNVIEHDDGTPDVRNGYHFFARTCDNRDPFKFSGDVGRIYEWPFANSLHFRSDSDGPSDPRIVTYPLMKQVVGATVSTWKPDICTVFSTDLLPGLKEGRWHSAWMTYVPPSEAGGIDLVGVPFSEWTPDGGLLLSATDQTFDAANPDHVAGARRLHEATRHLNPPSDFEGWDDDEDDLPGERID